jgi:tRNA nucleotidyltransferase (CCA-adding enzyme)
MLTDIFPLSCHNRVVLAGGIVRDILTGKESHDIDLIAALSHDELLELGFRLVEASSSAAIYFKYHHTFGKIEVTRINSMAELEQDLLRRDFTINAMAMTLTGEQIDPLGGEADVLAGLLNACSKESFTGDPLRIFRAFRFEAGDWRISSDTAALIREQSWSTQFSSMPVERFSNEMMKAMGKRRPELFFERMIEFSVGIEFLPELFRMPHIPAGPLEHHPEGDLLTHSVQVLQRVAARTDDPLTRFCAFFHDLGKLATNPALYPKHHGHDESGFKMADYFCNRLCLPANYRKALAYISRLHGKANKWDELRDSTKIRMAEQAIKAGVVEILPLISAADKSGNQPIAGWEDAVRVAALSTRELGIDQEKLEAMPIANRPSHILQRRIELLITVRSRHVWNH